MRKYGMLVGHGGKCTSDPCYFARFFFFFVYVENEHFLNKTFDVGFRYGLMVMNWFYLNLVWLHSPVNIKSRRLIDLNLHIRSEWHGKAKMSALISMQCSQLIRMNSRKLLRQATLVSIMPTFISIDQYLKELMIILVIASVITEGS